MLNEETTTDRYIRPSDRYKDIKTEEIMLAPNGFPFILGFIIGVLVGSSIAKVLCQ